MAVTDQQFTELTERVAALETSVTALETSVTALETSVATLTAANTAMRTAIQTVGLQAFVDMIEIAGQGIVNGGHMRPVLEAIDPPPDPATA